jgi:hypothetical protein
MILFSLKRPQHEVVKSSVNSRHSPFLERSQQISYRSLVDSASTEQMFLFARGVVDSCKDHNRFLTLLEVLLIPASTKQISSLA